MKKKYIKYIVVILLSFLQCYILLRYSKEKNIEDVGNTELKSISINKNVKIVNYNKLEDGRWKIKCLLNGSKEDVLNDIEKINYYEITEYNLSYEKNNVSIEANLIYK